MTTAAVKRDLPTTLYSVFTVSKAVKEGDKGIIEGIASTPTTDRQDDIVEPKGAEYKLPIPLLWQHDSDSPIGSVVSAKVTKDGIAIVAEVALGYLPEIDRAWTLIKIGLVRGLSIGFRPLEYSFVEETGGIRFMRWEWLELSAVTIPANQEASIQNIKSHDTRQTLSPTSGDSARAAGVVRLSPPDLPGQRTPKQSPQRGPQVKTIKEQMSAFEAKRAANVARMEELVKACADEGRTMNKEEGEEYRTLKAECKGIDEHLVILREHEALMVKSAEPAGQESQGTSGGVELPARVSPIQFGKSSLPKGVAFARYAMCKYIAENNPQMAAMIAKQRNYNDSSPEVYNVLNAESSGWNLKTAVAAGNTTDATWASPLAQYTNLAAEFIEYLRPLTVLGRLQGLRRVPFMVKIPRQTAGASGYWVGEGSGKPLSKLAFDSITMGPTKMATIVVITDELARVSSPSAETVIRDDIARALAQFADQQFLSPGVAAVANVNPASITFGATVVTSASAGGTSSVANVTTDVKAVFAGFFAANIDTTSAVWIMHPNTALALATMRTAQDIFAFPDITFQGGTFFGLPVIVSGNVPYSTSGGSPIVLTTPADIIVADEGGVTIDASREASLQMVDNPTSSAASLVSMYQTNQLAIRAERYINYAARRSAAVAYIDTTHY
jgi:HK97 family phage major capsid protein/HK97 family phage prohead protease